MVVRFKKAVVFTVIMALIAAFGGACNPAGWAAHATNPIEPGTWAFYWYLCGSNLETNYGYATDDLLEMLEVPLPENAVVVIQTGGAEKWQNEVIEADKLERYVYAGNELYFAEALPSASMGRSETLADFLHYCNENYPAEKQALILWDHGGGSIWGMMHDELYAYDSLSLDGLRAALEAAPAASGKYEMVGIDACLMATVDVVEILQGKARYLVASEELEPGIGWDYTGLFSALAADPSIHGAELGKAICDTYYAACVEYDAGFREVTLSVTDLDRAEALLAAYHAIGDEALLFAVKERQSYISAFGRAARNSLAYGKSGQEMDYEMVDLGDLVANAGHLLPGNGQALLDALNDCVIYQVRGEYRAKASGLTCYFSLSGDQHTAAEYQRLRTNVPFAYYHEYALQGELSDEGRAYVMDVAQQKNEPSPQFEALPQTNEFGLDGVPAYIGDDGYWQIDVGPDAASNLSAVFINLIWVEPESGLQVVWGSNSSLLADFDAGVFSERFNGEWGYIYLEPEGFVNPDSPNANLMQVYMSPISVDAERGMIVYEVPIELNGEEHSLHVGCVLDSDGSRAYEILGAWKTGDEQINAASKTYRQLVPGDVVGPIQWLRPFDEDGYYDDAKWAVVSGVVTENTHFAERSLGDGYFVFVFEMYDYAGNVYYSNPAGFRVRDGRMQRLPEGIRPMADSQPPDSIAAHYLRRHSFYHDGRDENIPYHTVIVSPDQYAAMAEVLGLQNGHSGDTMGGGYTIQIYSDSMDVDVYAGAIEVYLKGEFFAAETIYHQRDIVFRVTEIIDVW